MRRLLKSTGLKILLAVVATLLVGTIAAAFSSNKSTIQTSAVGTLFSPLQRISSSLSNKLAEFSINFRSSASLAAQKDELAKEVESLREQLVDYEQEKHKLDLYEEFLGVKEENPSFQFVSAPVIGRDVADKFQMLTLSKGSLHGVSDNDPVIYGKYLVGVVASVLPTQCRVRTLLDPAVNVSAYEISTRESGFVTTTVELSQKGLCRLPGLAGTTAIMPGAIVCTSGIGGIYPRNLIIGTVQEIVDDKADISFYAAIKPGAEIGKLEDVFIVVSFQGQLIETLTGE